MTIKAEMIPAYEWICDECGESNFASMIMHEGDPDTGIAGVMFMRPEKVACKSCHVEFECEYPEMEEVDE